MRNTQMALRNAVMVVLILVCYWPKERPGHRGSHQMDAFGKCHLHCKLCSKHCLVIRTHEVHLATVIIAELQLVTYSRWVVGSLRFVAYKLLQWGANQKSDFIRITWTSYKVHMNFPRILFSQWDRAFVYQFANLSVSLLPLPLPILARAKRRPLFT